VGKDIQPDEEGFYDTIEVRLPMPVAEKKGVNTRVMFRREVDEDTDMEDAQPEGVARE